MEKLPLVLIHVLAKDKEHLLDHWLKTQLDQIDYPKNRIGLYIRTNDNKDRTTATLEDWVNAQYGADTEPDDSYPWFNIELEGKLQGKNQVIKKLTGQVEYYENHPAKEQYGYIA